MFTTGSKKSSSISTLSPLELLNLSYANTNSDITNGSTNKLNKAKRLDNKNIDHKENDSELNSKGVNTSAIISPLCDSPILCDPSSDTEMTILDSKIITKDVKTVLLVGEADFSFTRALATRYKNIKFVATSLDSRKTLSSKYSNFKIQTIIKELNELNNVELLHNVDCTNLSLSIFNARKQGKLYRENLLKNKLNKSKTKTANNNKNNSKPDDKNVIDNEKLEQEVAQDKSLITKFDLCWFVFPHVGGATQKDIIINRNLLKNYLLNCFIPNTTVNHPNIKINKALITLRDSFFYNSWSIPSLKFIIVDDSTVVESRLETKSKNNQHLPELYSFPSKLLTGLGYTPERTNPSKSGLRNAPDCLNSYTVIFKINELNDDRIESFDENVLSKLNDWDDGDDNNQMDCDDDDDEESTEDDVDMGVYLSGDDDENDYNSDNEDEEEIGSSYTKIPGFWITEYDKGWLLTDDIMRLRKKKLSSKNLFKDTNKFIISIDNGEIPSSILDKRTKKYKSKDKHDKEKDDEEFDSNDDENEDSDNDDGNKKPKSKPKGLNIEKKKIPLHLMTRQQKIKTRRKEKASLKKRRRKEALIRSQTGK